MNASSGHPWAFKRVLVSFVVVCVLCCLSAVGLTRRAIAFDAGSGMVITELAFLGIVVSAHTDDTPASRELKRLGLHLDPNRIVMASRPWFENGPIGTCRGTNVRATFNEIALTADSYAVPDEQRRRSWMDAHQEVVLGGIGEQALGVLESMYRRDK